MWGRAITHGEAPMIRSVAPRPVAALAVCVSLVALAGCSRTPDGGPVAARTRALSFTPHLLADSTGECGGADRSRCTWVTLRWPEAHGGAAAESINAWIGAGIVSGTGERGSLRAAAPESVVTRFIAEFQKFHHDWPDAPGSWMLERTVTVMLDTLGVVTLAANEESFSGGAHGMHVSRHASFRVRDGHRLKLADLIAPGRDSAFAALGERAFRAARHIEPDRTLSEAGFFGEADGRFTFSDDIAIAPDGLRVHWDPYDIAPYAWGPTTLTLSWSELRPFARPDGALASFLR
jgi:hypothetical protein